MNLVQVKRVYDLLEVTDGFRILIDRLWPRGLKKETAHIDAWCKDIAPSQELRTWFHHESERFDLFRTVYLSELDKNPASMGFLNDCRFRLQNGNVTLLYAAKDTAYNHAVVLQEWMAGKIKSD